MSIIDMHFLYSKIVIRKLSLLIEKYPKIYWNSFEFIQNIIDHKYVWTI